MVGSPAASVHDHAMDHDLPSYAETAATIWPSLVGPSPQGDALYDAPPAGQVGYLAALSAVARALEAMESVEAECVRSASCAFAKNAMDAFLTHLGQKGSSPDVLSVDEVFWFGGSDGAPHELPLATVLKAFAGKSTLRQVTRAFAPALARIARRRGVAFQWGKAKGIRDAQARISFDVADRLPDLTHTENEILAAATAEAIVAAPVRALRDVTADQLLAALPAAPTAAPRSGVDALQARLRRLQE